jgi:hypothetical protein
MKRDGAASALADRVGREPGAHVKASDGARRRVMPEAPCTVDPRARSTTSNAPLR